MRRLGIILLSFWSGFNLLLAMGILLAIVFFHIHAPALHILFHAPEIAVLDPRVLATIDSLATIANVCIGAFCALMLYLIWFGIHPGTKHAYWIVLVSAGAVQIFGFVSDAFLGHPDLIANLVSTTILATGFILLGLSARS